MTLTRGERLQDVEKGQLPSGIAPGVYWFDGETWWCVPPREGLHVGRLSLHEVAEHPDRSISVTPSILYEPNGNGVGWHGYLESGVWREV